MFKISRILFCSTEAGHIFQLSETFFSENIELLYGISVKKINLEMLNLSIDHLLSVI